VALTLAGETNNNQDASGVINTPIRAYRSWDSDLDEAIHQAIDDGCDILNVSRYHRYESQSLRDAVDRAVSEDMLIIQSAGNNETDDPAEWNYPGVYDECLSVGAVREPFNEGGDMELAGFSNYGEAIDLAAPGTNIVIEPAGEDNRYFGGTSAAAPITAGVAAAVQETMGLTGQDLKRQLLDTAQPIEESSYRQQAGMVNAAVATEIYNQNGNMKTIIIEGTGPAAQYEFSVTGSLEKTTTEEANKNDNDYINGSTATGEVGSGADAYNYDGFVDSMEIDGHAIVRFE
jgi:serine protease